MVTERRLPLAVERAARELRAVLEAALGARLREVRAFGSMARGEAHEDSDIDVLVVLDRIREHGDRIAIFEAASDVALRHGLPLQPLVLDEGELRLLRERETALARDLERDGIPI